MQRRTDLARFVPPLCFAPVGSGYEEADLSDRSFLCVVGWLKAGVLIVLVVPSHRPDVSTNFSLFCRILADPGIVRDGSGTSFLRPRGRFRAPGMGFEGILDPHIYFYWCPNGAYACFRSFDLAFDDLGWATDSLPIQRRPRYEVSFWGGRVPLDLALGFLIHGGRARVFNTWVFQ